MQKLIWIPILIAIFLIGDRAAGKLLGNLTENSQFRYSRLYKGEGAADILLVGNSRGLGFFQPYIEELTGKKTFNLSYNGMPIDLAHVFVKDYLTKYPNTKKMVLDVTICDRVEEKLIASFSNYAPFSPNLDTLIKQIYPKGWYGGHVSNIYRYNSEIFQRALYYRNKPDNDWLIDRVINDKMIAEASKQHPYDLLTTTKNPELKGDRTVEKAAENNKNEAYILDNLSKTVHFAQSKGVDVQLVILPYYPAFHPKLRDLDWFKQKVERATGLEIHDYSKAIDDKNAFGDYMHINKHGSKLTMAKLKEDGIF
jgi:hypothetical protein